MPKKTIKTTSNNSPTLNDLLQQPQTNTFPTLQTILNQSIKDIQAKLPQPPPLLNGILLLDKMLNKSSGTTNDDKNHTISSSSSPPVTNNGWYNVTSNYQTKASIV